MATKLERPLKREVAIGGAPYIITIDPLGLKLVPKGKRKGLVLEWVGLISGDAALAQALNASLAKAPEPPEKERPARDRRHLKSARHVSALRHAGLRPFVPCEFNDPQTPTCYHAPFAYGARRFHVTGCGQLELVPRTPYGSTAAIAEIFHRFD